jgi:hypothetical protein
MASKARGNRRARRSPSARSGARVLQEDGVSVKTAMQARSCQILDRVFEAAKRAIPGQKGSAAEKQGRFLSAVRVMEQLLSLRWGRNCSSTKSTLRSRFMKVM